MQRDDNWSKATKKAFNEARNEFAKKNPRSEEAKRRKRSAKKRELWKEFQKKTKELDRQMATSDDDEE